MRQIANNTFNDGMLMDMQPLTTPNSVLTDCLNGTLITYDGNEFVLQSDDGNGKIYDCKLPKDFIPLGMKEYGGIVYIVSQNPFTGECEIGSFPSPESTIFTDSRKDYPETILTTKDLGSNLVSEGITNQTIKLDFGDINSGLLRPGDKFAIYITDSSGQSDRYLDNDSFKTFESLLEVYENLQLKTRNLFKLKLVRISEDGVSESIKEIVPAFTKSGSTGQFYYNKVQILEEDEYHSPDGFYAVYNNKINGYLAVILELEQIDEFNIIVGETINITEKDSEGNPTKFNFSLKMDSTTTLGCKNNTTGAEIITTVVDSNGGEVDIPISEDVPISEDLEDWELYNGTTYKVAPYNSLGSKTVTIDTTVGDFNTDDNIKVEIKPFSAFNYFNNLKYENIFNYNKLTLTQESTIWKYYLDKSIDSDITPDKMMMSFDFFVRGTLNGRNKLDALYIEFYDVVADASFYYPIQSISDSKTLSINCFPESEYKVVQDSSGGLSGEILTTQSYYLLINRNKINAYNQALSKIDKNDSSGYQDLLNMSTEDIDTIKNIPGTWKLESVFTNSIKRYNTLGIELKEKYSKLRINNFYLVAICGLDFYKDSKGILQSQKYIVCNFMWTNGVFNKYWQLSGGDNDNFNAKTYPDFLKIEYTKNKTPWDDNLSVGELSLDPSAESNNKLSFQSYSKPLFDIGTSNARFDTKININGTISNQYKLTINTDLSVLNYGKLNIGEDQITYTKPSSSPRTLSQSEVSIRENNNEAEILSTDSSALTVTISDGKGGTGYNPRESIDVKFELLSNRKIKDQATEEDLVVPKYVYSQFRDSYDLDLIPTTILTIGVRTSNKNAIMWIEALSDFVLNPIREGQLNDDNELGRKKNYTISEVASIISQKIADKCVLVHLVNCDDERGRGSNPDGDYSPGLDPCGYVYINIVSEPIIAASNAESSNQKYWTKTYNGKLFLAISGTYFSGYNLGKYALIPLNYSCTTSSGFISLRDNLNYKFKNNLYLRTINNSAEEPYLIPNIGLISYHGDFDTIYDFNVEILKLYIKDAQIYTYINGTEQLLGESAYKNFRNYVQQTNTINIGKLFNEKYDFGDTLLYRNNLPNQSISKDIRLEDSFTLKGSRFILTRENARYTISNLVEELRKPSSGLDNTELPNTDDAGNTVFDNTLFVENNNKYYDSSFTYSSSEGFNCRGSIIYDNKGMTALCKSDKGKTTYAMPIMPTLALSDRVINFFTSGLESSTSPFK